jgi:hypothetical protein
MQVETAAVRLPFSVGAGFRLPVAVRGTPSDGVNFIPYMKLMGVE